MLVEDELEKPLVPSPKSRKLWLSKKAGPEKAK
jgi:hypothetical protein